MLGLLIVVFCAILGYRQRPWQEFIATEAFRVAITGFQVFAFKPPLDVAMVSLAIFAAFDATAFLLCRWIGGRRKRAA